MRHARGKVTRRFEKFMKSCGCQNLAVVAGVVTTLTGRRSGIVRRRDLQHRGCDGATRPGWLYRTSKRRSAGEGGRGREVHSARCGLARPNGRGSRSQRRDAQGIACSSGQRNCRTAAIRSDRHSGCALPDCLCGRRKTEHRTNRLRCIAAPSNVARKPRLGEFSLQTRRLCGECNPVQARMVSHLCRGSISRWDRISETER